LSIPQCQCRQDEEIEGGVEVARPPIHRLIGQRGGLKGQASDY